MDAPVKTLRHVVNPEDNGGEQITITTDFFDNGDDELYTHHKIELQSYGNSMSLALYGASLTPTFLRKMADDIDRAYATYVPK